MTMKRFKKSQAESIKAMYVDHLNDIKTKVPPEGLEDFQNRKIQEIELIIALCDHIIDVDDFIPWEVFDPSEETLRMMGWNKPR
jgi:hypothetical protein